MKFWAGVTDNEWFPFLASRGLDEVNFWRPSPGPYFTGLPAGTPFLFKLKAPYNHIAGGGFFVQYSSLPLEMAWDAFGEKNGMTTFREFDHKIRAYRKLSKGPFEMGCKVHVQWFCCITTYGNNFRTIAQRFQSIQSKQMCPGFRQLEGGMFSCGCQLEVERVRNSRTAQ